LFKLLLLLFYSIISRAICTRTNRRRTLRRWWCLRRVILARDSMQIGRAWPRCASTYTHAHLNVHTCCHGVLCSSSTTTDAYNIMYNGYTNATHIFRPRGPLINRLSAFLSRGRAQTHARVMTLYYIIEMQSSPADGVASRPALPATTTTDLSPRPHDVSSNEKNWSNR